MSKDTDGDLKALKLVGNGLDQPTIAVFASLDWLLSSHNLGFATAMSDDEIERLIARAIRDHEIRVAAISAAMGAVLIVGTWHAIWILR